MAYVQVAHISKTFGARSKRRGGAEPVQAVRDVSFHIDRGESLGLVGESGSGKSTIGRIVLRLIDADMGSVRVGDRSITELGREELRRARRQMQMVFQDPFGSLDPRMVIGDLVAEPMKVHGIGDGPEDRRDRVAALIERVGLTPHHLERFPYEFSGGQLQRVAIARALATDPVFLVCDEPVAALDVSVQAQVLNLLMELQAERGLACLLISHDLSLVRLLVDRVAVIHSGVIVETGPTEDVYEDPQHPYTRRLLQAVPGRDPDHRSLLTRARQYRPPVPLASTGCRFASRCELVTEQCLSEVPELRRIGASDVACHQAGDRLRPTPTAATRAAGT